VLWISESPRLHTGHGRVAHEITRRLAGTGRYELGILGWAVEPPLESGAGYTEFPPGAQPWSPTRVNQVIEEFGPDVVVTSGPLSALGMMGTVPLREVVSWVGYAFFEASPLATESRAALGGMDRAVVPSRWCQSVLAGGHPDEARPGPAVRLIRLGVDTHTFRPRPDREVLRAALDLEDRFVIGCVAANDFRKQIPILVKAFAVLAECHREALLYLHMDPDGPGWRLPELVRRYGVENRVAFTRGLAGPMGIASGALNVLYNLFDVMALPTMGEAFGLPILEAMAAGIPVIATACSSVTELVEGRGELVAVRDWVTMNWDNAEYALADVDDLVAKLTRLHGDQDLRKEYSRKGRAFAQTMSWDHTVSGWMRLLDSLAPRTAAEHRGVLASCLHGVRRAARQQVSSPMVLGSS